MRNFRLKALSLLIAAFFWYFVTTNVSTMTLSVPIEIRNSPPEKVLLSTFSPQAQVKVSGPSFMVSSIASSPPTFKIKVPPDAQNRYVEVLKAEDLSLPSAIQVISIEPAEVEIRFDERAAKEVAVEVPQIGALAESLKLDSVTVTPKTVNVSGPRSQVERIARVETYPIDLRDVRGDMKTEVPLRKPGGLVNIAGEAVLVRVEVTPVVATRRFQALPVELRSVDGAQVALEPRSVHVEVSGSRALIESLEPDQIIPYARVTKAAPSNEKVKVACEVPKGVSVVAIEPKEVAIGVATPIPSPPPPMKAAATKVPEREEGSREKDFSEKGKKGGKKR